MHRVEAADDSGEPCLCFQIDTATGTGAHWGSDYNIRTGRRDRSWTALSGAGTLYSWTRSHLYPVNYAGPRNPLLLAFVDLDEGPRVLARLATPEGYVPQVGQRVLINPALSMEAGNVLVAEVAR